MNYTEKVSKDDFSLISVIGTGSYGKVLLVKKKGVIDNLYYAMKVIKKKHIRQNKQVQHTWNERKILEKINSPFVVKMRYAFQNEKKLFFVLDYCPGGELFFYINNIKRFNEDSAKFYASNIILGIECLHDHDVLYRE
jgi:serine/threonine protein kinase